ncbi:DsbA family protein [Candidatus Pelagibacter sp. HIMB1517]|uniref:DsbA family protein n=1 Tax=Candidatus Pelagibacter sp. HIMB1517 TaxID=3413341 RepID=UPI003F83B93E
MIKNKILICIFVTFFAMSANAKDDFPYYGKLDPEPKIVIKVFSSLTCPHCADFHLNVMPKLLEKYVLSEKVLIKLMDFPLDLSGLKAAQIQKCLPLETQKSYLDEIYKTQPQWTTAKTLKELESNIEKITSKLGLQGKDFQDCLKNKKNEDAVLQSRIKAQSKYEIDSTPTLIINEKKFKGSTKELEKYIDKLL